VLASDAVLPFLSVAPGLLFGPLLALPLSPCPLVPGVGAGLLPAAAVVVGGLLAAEPPVWVLSVFVVLSAGAFACWSAGAGGGLFGGGLLGAGLLCGGFGASGAVAVASSKASNGESLLLFCVLVVVVCQRCAAASALVAPISDAILDVLGTANL
jgi:hypothetical protein